MLKDFIRLFLPPLYYQCKKRIKNGGMTNDSNVQYNQYDFIKLIAHRTRLPFQDIQELAKDIPLEYIDIISRESSESLFYGGFQTLVNYCGLSHLYMPPNKVSIQHGYVFEMTDWDRNKDSKLDLVWSESVKEMYHNNGISTKIRDIGAPFFYATTNLSDKEILDEKKRLGKNLLAFPMHSTHCYDTYYNKQSFIKLLNRQKRKFDSVRVCLYWKDILRGDAEEYQKAGFECVTCGHLLDPSFLNRQKTLFAICDATISNGVGSHIGYSVYMNKPHWLMPDTFEMIDRKGSDGKENMELINNSIIYHNVCQLFIDNESFSINNEQRIMVDKYWGISSIRSKTELSHIILDAYNY